MTHLKYVKMSYDLISASSAAIFKEMEDSSFSTDVCPVPEIYAVVKLLLDAGKARDELSSYRPLYDSSFCVRCLKPHVFNLMII